MTDFVVQLVRRYRSRGILVDANILLLYFAGGFDRAFIGRFKRTRQFTPKDYEGLVRLLNPFRSVITTPNILSEVNSLAGQLGEPARTRYFDAFARGIRTLDERYVASADVSKLEPFSKLGLTDSGILHLASRRYLVLTDDLKLCAFLGKQGIDALNFNHVRSI